MSKCFEDALRSLKVLEDDSPEFVAESVIEIPPRPWEDVPREISEDQARCEATKGSKREDWLEIIITPYQKYTYVNTT
jgi:hypothetical protein